VNEAYHFVQELLKRSSPTLKGYCEGKARSNLKEFPKASAIASSLDAPRNDVSGTSYDSSERGEEKTGEGSEKCIQ